MGVQEQYGMTEVCVAAGRQDAAVAQSHTKSKAAVTEPEQGQMGVAGPQLRPHCAQFCQAG